MEMKKIKFLLFFSACLSFTSAGTTKVVLQNGLNEYEGCTDTWIYNRSPTSNNGKAITFNMQQKEQKQ